MPVVPKSASRGADHVVKSEYEEEQNRKDVTQDEDSLESTKDFTSMVGCYDKFVYDIEKFFEDYTNKCYFKTTNINNISGTPKQDIYTLLSEDFKVEDYSNHIEHEVCNKLISEFLVSDNLYYVMMGLSLIKQILKQNSKHIGKFMEHQVSGSVSQLICLSSLL